MRYFQVPNPTTAQKLNTWAALVVRPRPLIYDNATIQRFGVVDHPVDSAANGSLLSIPETGGGSEVSIHPITKAIIRTAGGTLSSSDADLAEQYWEARYKNYTEPDGSQPYQSFSDFKQFIKDVWVRFEEVYPDTAERGNVTDSMLNNSHMKAVDLVPSSTLDDNGNMLTVTEKTGLDTGELFIEKWFVWDFNQLSKAQLETSRFPGIGSTLAGDIVSERDSNGPYASPEDVSDRVNGVGPSLQSDIQSWVDEGSLTFGLL